MRRIFCCRSRKTSNVEEDRITDSLEVCLSHERGINEFRQFLETKRLDEETLQVFLECDRLLREIERLSPGGKGRKLPDNIRNAISRLYEMAKRINLSSGQVTALQNLLSNNINIKIGAIQELQNAAVDLLQDSYKIFRREFLKRRSLHRVRSTHKFH